MASIKRFEDIQAWQKAREPNKLIYKETGKGAFAKDYPLKTRRKDLQFQ